MDSQGRNSFASQHAAQSSDSQQHDSRSDNRGDLTSSRQPHMTLPRAGTPSGFQWSEGSLQPDPLDGPPQYDSHQFPPTPPALHSPGLDGGAYFDQGHYGDPNQATPPIDSAWPPTSPQPRALASRFPRWGTWLEKRALERHYANLDSQAASQQALGVQGDAAPIRKKSWGAWVNDADAVSDIDSSFASPQQAASPDLSSQPPLHLHHFGSRFIPHLPAQPLCSILVELPAPDNHTATHSGPRGAPPRQVLLIGTAQGLFAVQLRQSQPSAPSSPPQASAASPSLPTKQWNENVRCIPIWTGLAVYQMCVLASNEDNSSGKARALQSQRPQSSGVFLALTCPSSARDGFLTSSLMQLSAHAGSILESVAASGMAPSNSSTSSHNSHNVNDLNDGVAAANFGATAGGGPGRAVPPGGTGAVRMWHLQAIRELLIYALDRPDAQIPIDLEPSSAGTADKRGGLGNIFKKTFSRPKPRSEAKSAVNVRSASDASLSATVTPLPRTGQATTSPSSPQRSNPSSPRAKGQTLQSRNRDAPHSPHGTTRPLPRRSSTQKSPPLSRRPPDPSHAAAISLAANSVRIQPPPRTAAATNSNNASRSSLFADDLIQSFTSTRQAAGKGKDREAVSQAASKGVLFFSVHEAGRDTKGAGTWYLAITYARSVMIYEASVPKHGSSRAWSFVKELYAPFPIKAVAFTPAAVSDEVHPFTSLGSLSANAGPTKLRVASADGPLSTSKKSNKSDHGHSNSVMHEGGTSKPVQAARGSAAPASWHKADLCVLLSFGRRAVLVRLRDSYVREMELKPLSQLLTTAGDPERAALHQMAQRPQQRMGTSDLHSRTDRSRPISMPGDDGQRSDSQPSSTHGHNRTFSLEQKFRDAILDKRSNKHNWVGFSSIEARILIRQWSDVLTNGRGTPGHGYTPGRNSSALLPVGLSMTRSASGMSSPSLAGVDKDLPRAPAHQNASFDKRMSRLHLSEQSWQDHAELQAEASSDSDDEDGTFDARERAATYQLTDPGPLPQIQGWPNTAYTRYLGPAQSQSATPKRSFSLPPAEPVTAKLALASRGSVTHVMQLPLAADLAQANPLAVMQWSDTPNAVSGWARVLGVERASSMGSTPLNHLRQFSTPSTPVDRTGSPSLGLVAADLRRRNNRLVLHVGVTCVAFLASRVEARKVTFKIPVDLDFNLSPDSELELIGVATGKDYSRANGVSNSHANEHTPAQETPSSHGGVDDDAASLGDGWRASQPTPSFAYPPAAPAHSTDESVPISRSEASAVSQELEYLCAPLLTFNPIDLDPRSCGSQSLILPSGTSTSGPGGKNVSSESTAHALFPEMAGDAGVIAFDWRGADDFRIFTVGIAG